MREMKIRKLSVLRVMIIHFSLGGCTFDVPASLLSVDEVRTYGVKWVLMRCKHVSKMWSLNSKKT